MRLMFAAFLLQGALLSSVGLGADASKDVSKEMSLGFTAPVIFDNSTLGDNRVGDIVYDAQDERFYGYGSQGNWAPLSGTSTAWASYSPGNTYVTNATTTGYYRIDQDQLHVRVKTAFSGASDSGNFIVDLPVGRTINTTVLMATQHLTPVGSGVLYDSSTTQRYLGSVAYYDTDSVVLHMQSMSGGTAIYSANADFGGAANPFTAANGDSLQIEFSVPIN